MKRTNQATELKQATKQFQQAVAENQAAYERLMGILKKGGAQ
jgi:hypothetical protein